MGIIQVDLFTTLDGVYQAPGGPGEDREGGFALGGWQGAYVDDESGEAIGADVQRLDALLLGRRTYDIFAGYWPGHGDDDPIATKFNAVPKFVVSRTLTDPSWEATTVLRDVAAEVRALKDRFGEVHVFGSGELVTTLLREDLVDRLRLILYPLILGSGKRIFGAGTVPAAFTLVKPPQAFPKGAISLVYERTGEPVTGVDVSQPSQ
ncbi:dihydrofolate reductase family protein [Kocuria rosea]|jgi:dihydrofolate reductase|uniref:dihydrofolate reductase family protein n=2 Tax=Kocuria TaxID=57493 RepID=UPI00203ECA8B|nr:dihydrofolate reductase family protein [Kocuria rosea]MCM3689456.1 dihydrofolate reductase family protein [Kocuria rosea]HST72265.1 dihydrofolate reductase family protein [Kocuria rosea]